MGQIASVDDKAVNLDSIRVGVRRAAREGADLVVFPEFSMYEQKVIDRGLVDAAEPLEGDFTRTIREIAADNGVAVLAGFVEAIADEPRAYNTIYVADAQGRYLAHYRKLHLFDAFGIRESDLIRPSEEREPTTFEVEGVTVGIMTCYDLRFPELARDLVDHGAEVIVIPSAWAPGPRKEDHWRTLSRARAIENTVYVVAVSQAPPAGTGGSLFIDPMGVVLAELAEEPGIATQDVDLRRVEAVRTRIPSLANRRYAVLLNP